MTNAAEDVNKFIENKISNILDSQLTQNFTDQIITKSEIQYYNLPPSVTKLPNVNQYHHYENESVQEMSRPTTHATLTPPPSPPNSEDTQKLNKDQSQVDDSEISLLMKEPRRPPRACDSTDTMLASAATSIHNYYNLINFENKSGDILNSAPVTPPPPRLPKRRPFLVTQSRSQSPPSSFTFENSSKFQSSESNNNNHTSSISMEEDFQHHALEHGFNSNFAGSRVGIQGGPPPLRRMSTGSRGSFNSSATANTVFSQNNNMTNSRNDKNHSALNRDVTCHSTHDSVSNFMTTSAVVATSSCASSATNPVLHHARPGTNGCRNGHNNVPSSFNNINNNRSSKRFNSHQPSSLNSSIRRSGRRSTNGSSCRCKTSENNKSEDDVILFYSRHCTGAVEWAKYLHKLYTELSKHKGRLRVRHLPLEDMGDCILPQHIEEEIFQSRLQIVLLSPTLLQFLSRCPSLPIGRLLHPDRVLAIMLGVKDSLITQEHRSVLVSFSQWIHLEAKDHDLEFVQTVLYFSTQILQRSDSKRVHRAGSVCSNASSMMNGRNLNGCRAESTIFSIQPKKLSEGQSRFMVVFENPQSTRCRFKVTLERHHTSGLVDVELTEARLKNPYNLQVNVPSCCFSESVLAGVRLEIDGIDRGSRTIKIESTLSELEYLLKMNNDPIEFMCQAFAISPMCKEKLDQKLSQQFLQNSPKMGFSILRGTTVESLDPAHLQNGFRETSCDFPTLLHFSAHHGLERLTSVLLECPGAAIANQMKNCSDMTPSELAQVNGNIELSNRLQHFQKPSQSYQEKHVYDYIHQTPHESSIKAYKESNTPPPPLLRSNNLRADYQVPPPPRPIEQFETHAATTQKYVKMIPESQNQTVVNDSSKSKRSTTPVRQIRLPSLSVITSTLRLRSKERGDSFTALDQLINQSKENKPTTPQNSKLNLTEKSPEYQVIQSPPHQALGRPQKDPYGTMRASKRIGGRFRDAEVTERTEDVLESKNNNVGSVTDYEDDDVFSPPTEVTRNKTNSLSLSTIPNDPSDPFGTLRANKAINNRVLSSQAVMGEHLRTKEQLPSAVISNKEKHLIDYRGIPANNCANDSGAGGNASSINEDLVITDELLQLLEDFKTKSYSMKEMEMLFENWRRKAAIYENGSDKDETLSKTSQSSTAKDEMEKIKNKLRRLKASNTIIKFFKSSSNGQKHLSSNVDEILNIRHTKDTQTFRKPCLISEQDSGFMSLPVDNCKTIETPEELRPIQGNQTIIEGEIGIFEEDDEDINIVTLPPTPFKTLPNKENLDCGISTQILPLSRLSLSSNNNSTPPSSSSSSPQEPTSSNHKAKNSSKSKKGTHEDKSSKSTKKLKSTKDSKNISTKDLNEKLSGVSETVMENRDTSESTLIVPNNTFSSNMSTPNTLTSASTSTITLNDNPALNSTTPTNKKISPVRDRLDKLKKSLTDPLLHYFQISPECEEEPDLLNTPRSLAPPHLSTSNTMTISTTEVQNYGFIATEIDEFSRGQSSPVVPKKLFLDSSIKETDNHMANSSNDEGFSDNFKREDTSEDNDENLPTPPPTPPPPIVTDM